MWYLMLQSGVQSTLSGVLLAFAIPFQKGEEQSISYKLQHHLHKPAAFIIVPLFALANTCIVFSDNFRQHLFSNEAIGINTGLVIGKPLGILLFSSLAVLLGICAIPNQLQWKHIAGAGLLAGIGFTMSIFITMLAYTDSIHVNTGKMAIMAASAIAAVLGFGVLKVVLRKN